MDSEAIEWVLAMEAPVEADWRSIEFSGIATFSVAGDASGETWTPLATSVDSMAMVNCVVESVIKETWR